MAKKPDSGPEWVQAPDGSWHQRVGPAPAPAEKKDSSPGVGCLVLMVLAVIIGGAMVISSNKPKPAAAPPGTTASGAAVPVTVEDDKSSHACLHFRNIAGDISKGLLTDAEMRSKFKEVNDNAIIGTKAVQKAAQSMLSAATIGDASDVLSAMGDMDKACKASAT